MVTKYIQIRKEFPLNDPAKWRNMMYSIYKRIPFILDRCESYRNQRIVPLAQCSKPWRTQVVLWVYKEQFENTAVNV